MNEDPLRYDKWVEESLCQVIRKSLRLTEEMGLQGEHHFYITFLTDEPGVRVPAPVRASQGPEMTIVLQHQFSGLCVHEDGFDVTLSFAGRPENLTIPFAAITSFTDPSVNFGLQLKSVVIQDGDEAGGEEGHGDDGPGNEARGNEGQGNEDRKGEDRWGEGRWGEGRKNKDRKNKDRKNKDRKGEGPGDEDRAGNEQAENSRGSEVIALDAYRKK